MVSRMNQTPLRIVWWSALYDLLVTLPFASPWTAAWISSALGALHVRLGLSGAPPTLDTPTALLFTNLMGSVVVVWSVVRLLQPTAFHGLADSVARLLFSSWMLYALLHGASPIVALFLVAELAWGLAQLALVAPHPWPALRRPASS